MSFNARIDYFIDQVFNDRVAAELTNLGRKHANH